MKTQVLKIAGLKFDPELYPRLKVGWLTAYQYAQAMKAGSVFPPIVAGRFSGQLYVVDGWHRVEAKKILGEEYVEGVVKEYKSREDMFVEAIKLNVSHGRPLSVQEKVRLIKKLEDLNFSLEQISKIVLVPVERVEVFKARAIVGPNGKPIYIKSAVARAVETPEEAAGVDMSRFSVRNVADLLEQLIELLESDVYPFDNKRVKELTVRLFSLLQDKLELKAEAM